MNKTLILILALVLSTSVFAKTITKKARANDVASKYELQDNGNLFRYIKGTNQKCQITNDVKEFKISRHKSDAAMIYYKRNGDLYYLKNASNNGSCPKAKKDVLLSDVKKYTVVSNTNTNIVNIALSKNGVFKAWGNTDLLYKESNVEKYVNNTCYGSSGKSFKSYVAFAITYSGNILKIKGQSVNSSKVDSSRFYKSVQEFKKQNNVCK